MLENLAGNYAADFFHASQIRTSDAFSSIRDMCLLFQLVRPGTISAEGGAN